MDEHRNTIQARPSLPDLHAPPLALPGLLNKNLCKSKHSHLSSFPSILSLGEVFGILPLGVITRDSLIQTLVISWWNVQRGQAFRLLL